MNKLFVVISIAIFFVIYATSCGSQKTNQNTDLKDPQPTINNNQASNMPKTNDENYFSYWKTIDSLEAQGLPQSALEKLNELYEIVIKDNEPAQTIKCLIYKGKYESQLEEDGLVKAIVKMQNEMESAGFPVKPILQSMLAELFTNYLNNNYWRFNDRTQTTDFDNNDVRTWTIEQLVAQSRKLYFNSVADLRSQQVDLSKFDVILSGNNEYHDFRPTLYDFLMHRAIDYLTSENSYLTEPAYKYYIDKNEAFASVSEFVNYKFETKDDQSPKYRVLLLLQDLLRFHQTDADPKALIEVDLKRLNFVYENAVLSSKDALYLEALKALETKFAIIRIFS